MILHLWNLIHLPIQVARLTENGTRNSRWEGNRVAVRGFKQLLLKEPHLVDNDRKLSYKGMISCCISAFSRYSNRAQADPIFFCLCRTAATD